MDWSAPGYDPGKLRSYHNALLIADSFCGSATLDLNTGTVLSLVLERNEDDVNESVERIANHPLLPKKAALVTIISLPDQSVMVPELLASDKEGEAHLKLLHGETLSGGLRDRNLEEWSARFYFKNDRTLENLLLRTWPSAMLYPMQLAVTRSALARVVDRKTTLLLHVLGERTDMAIVNPSGPQLVNTFVTKTAEDLLYYALYASDQLGLNKEETEVFYAGPQCSETHIALLEEYFRTVKPAVSKNCPPELSAAQHLLGLTERDICVS